MIEKGLDPKRSIYPPLNQEICIESINSGSLEIIINFLSSPEGQLTAATISVPATLKALGKFLRAISKSIKDSSETYRNFTYIQNSKKLTEAECRLKNAQAHQIEIANQISTVDDRQLSVHEEQFLDERLSGNVEFNSLVDQFTAAHPILKERKELTYTSLNPLKNAVLNISKTGKINPEITLPTLENYGEN
ncbi:hypothetical protein [Maridesulfovibrio sp.]|uniref:hypothetical protein n=1 Tax=Maridesulfovibrio sp. TaxID=2795000 RepID=UPI002A18B1A7|nr:hypothetical protein [Maridesulfovibrio sp.]